MSSPTPDPSRAAPPALSSELDREIAAAMKQLEAEGAGGFAGADPSAPKTIRGPRVVEGGREHRTGAVVSVGPTDVFVEFGPKELGVVERVQWGEGDELPKPGESLEVVVDRYDRNESILICSRPGAVKKADWEMLEPGQVVEARVSGVTKGGLELEVAQHRAFMPASQVTIEHVKDLSIFVGEKMNCEVVRVDRRGRGNIVLSRRNILERERAELAEQLKSRLAEGQTVSGTVRKIMAFGAFVDIGGVDGLIHLSDLTYDRVGHGERAVEKYVKVGEQVTVQILKLDWEANRISLGMKQTQSDPFATALNDIVEGAVVSGRVTKILEFGAFVELAPGVEGLVHISELDWRRVANVADVVKPDEVVQVKVIKIDPESRKISLSVKQTKDAPAQAGGPRGRGRGRGFEDSRSADEILKETPALRRMREKAKQNESKKGQSKGKGGLGQSGGLGMGLGDLKL